MTTETELPKPVVGQNAKAAAEALEKWEFGKQWTVHPMPREDKGDLVIALPGVKVNAPAEAELQREHLAPEYAADLARLEGALKSEFIVRRDEKNVAELKPGAVNIEFAPRIPPASDVSTVTLRIKSENLVSVAKRAKYKMENLGAAAADWISFHPAQSNARFSNRDIPLSANTDNEGKTVTVQLTGLEKEKGAHITKDGQIRLSGSPVLLRALEPAADMTFTSAVEHLNSIRVKDAPPVAYTFTDSGREDGKVMATMTFDVSTIDKAKLADQVLVSDHKPAVRTAAASR
jgi:hypothetical protein